MINSVSQVHMACLAIIHYLHPCYLKMSTLLLLFSSFQLPDVLSHSHSLLTIHRPTFGRESRELLLTEVNENFLWIKTDITKGQSSTLKKEFCFSEAEISMTGYLLFYHYFDKKLVEIHTGNR